MTENKQKSLTINAILNVCKTAVVTFFPVLTYMYVSRIFGTDGMGKLNYSKSIIEYFQMLAMLGIANYASSCVAKVKDNRQKRNKLVTEIIVINISSMLVAYILLYFLLIFVKELEPYCMLISIYSLLIFLQVIGIEWFYNGTEEYLYITIRSFIVQLFSLACVFLFVKTKADIITYSFIQVTAAGGANIFNFIHAKKQITLENLRKIELRQHFQPIITIFLMTLFLNVFTRLDTTMIGIFQNDHAVGLYGAGDKMSSLVANLIGAISVVILPRIAYLKESGKQQEMKRSLVYVANIILLLSIPACVGLVLLARPITLLFNGNYFTDAIITTRILSCRVLLSPINALFVLYCFIPLGMERYSLFSTGIASIFNFVANLVFINMFSYNGAAITTVLAEVVEFTINLILVRKLLPTRRLFGCVWQYLLGAFVIVICYICISLFSINIYAEMICFIIFSVILYMSLLYALKNETAQLLIYYVKTKLGRIVK